jgi:hypothetical protein
VGRLGISIDDQPGLVGAAQRGRGVMICLLRYATRREPVPGFGV